MTQPTATEAIASALTDFGVRASLRPGEWQSLMKHIDLAVLCAEILADPRSSAAGVRGAERILRSMIERDASTHAAGPDGGDPLGPSRARRQPS